MTCFSNELDLQAAKIYTAAFTLSGMFVQFVLQAIETEICARLTALSDDYAAMRQRINEQTEVGLFPRRSHQDLEEVFGCQLSW
ncbi:hypothetical protein LOC70_11970 [Rhodopirellula sp. JC737]|nr:hypothetical protein [Rhodopirellula sp. JC737]